MDDLVAAESSPTAIAMTTASYLPALLNEPAFLPDIYRIGSEEAYMQHILHVHSQGLYSIVALVWLPGQRTPVHDHRCWCVVGVLEGREHETRYRLYMDEPEQDSFLFEYETTTYDPGEVCWLVPPDEDIHRVSNRGSGTGISIHVYGADISKVGTSINHIFRNPVRTTIPEGARRVSWRKSK